MRPAYLLLATALLATVAACTDELGALDEPNEQTLEQSIDESVGAPSDDPAGVDVAEKVAVGDVVIIADAIEPTSCVAPKVLVCHIPPGNPDNAHNICISDWAVSAHLMQHGDNVGGCAKRTVAPPPPVCMPLGSECTQDLQCCSNACVWDECIDHI